MGGCGDGSERPDGVCDGVGCDAHTNRDGDADRHADADEHADHHTDANPNSHTDKYADSHAAGLRYVGDGGVESVITDRRCQHFVSRWTST